MNINASILLMDRLLHALAVRAILPGGFHAHVVAVVVNQPLFELKNGIVKSGKSLFEIMRGDPLGSD